MDQTLLPQADSFDKANTYVLNTVYNRHKADSTAKVHVITEWLVVLLVVLGLMQLALMRKFRRFVNVGLAGATVLAASAGLFTIARLGASSDDLAVAREKAFDAVHELARARATVVAARQSEGQFLLDPSSASVSQIGFSTQVSKVLRLRNAQDATVFAQSGGNLPLGAGGYLTTVMDADISNAARQSATQTLIAFGDFLAADQTLRSTAASGASAVALTSFRNGEPFKRVTAAIDHTQHVDQAVFNTHARAAGRAVKHLDAINLVTVLAIVVLSIFGLYQRLREYR